MVGCVVIVMQVDGGAGPSAKVLLRKGRSARAARGFMFANIVDGEAKGK